MLINFIIIKVYKKEILFYFILSDKLLGQWRINFFLKIISLCRQTTKGINLQRNYQICTLFILMDFEYVKHTKILD